jgi:hypothetical protein
VFLICSKDKKAFALTVENHFIVSKIRKIRKLHITPRSQGGLNRYENLQLLHRACHVRKTDDDKMKYRRPLTTVNSTVKGTAILQEPDEVKVSRPDLKTKG